MTPVETAKRGLRPAGPAPHRGLFLAMVGALIGICVIFTIVMWDARSDAREAAEAASANLATALSHDLDRNVELLDLSVRAARDAWSDPRVRDLEPEMREFALFDQSASARYIDAVLVVGRDGTVLADSRSAVPRARNLHDRDFFTAQRDRDAGLFIGKPMQVSGKPGWRIALSRRMTADDGTFAGVAVGFLDLGYLDEAYRGLPLGRGGVLSLFNVDGSLLIRAPEDRSLVGTSFRGRALFDTMAAAPSGTVEATPSYDHITRLYAFQRVGRLPLIQVVGSATDVVYARWRAKAVALGAVLASLCCGTVALLLLLRRELIQRIAAESALEALASTDHLTGLLNRRKFFALAEPLCAETMAHGDCVAVVMLDADHFKGYNDRYGHVAGDAVLAGIGSCIAAHVPATDALAARYGGEEFILLLPGLDRGRAFMLAERIRAAVARLAVPHGGSPFGVVSVSTGIVSVEASAGSELRALVEAADAELYRSKRDGRNRSSIAAPPAARSATPLARSA